MIRPLSSPLPTALWTQRSGKHEQQQSFAIVEADAEAIDEGTGHLCHTISCQEGPL